MNGKLQAVARVEISADASAVWRALTDPQIVKEYFFGTQLEADWKTGGKIYFRGSWEGKSYEDKGTILRVEPPRLLRYSYWSSLSGKEDIPENHANITYELAESNGFTTLTVTQDGADSEESRDHSASNWKMVFEGMKKIVEERPESHR